MRKIILTIVVVLAIEALGWAVYVLSGSYNVSVLNHDSRFINWWLDTAMSRSVRHHSRGITPPALDNPAMVQEGFRHYNEMCVYCHGAPGKSAKEIAKGIWPSAPDLGNSAGDMTAAELFWVTKNGIKFTVMPAWGPTHSDEKIWAIVAFIEKLPKLSAADYHQMETNTVGVTTSVGK